MNLLFSKRKQYTCVTCNALNCAYFFVVLVHNLHERGPDRRGAAGFYLFIFILSELFFHITHEGIHDHQPSALYWLRPRSASCDWGRAPRCFFFFFFLHLISAHTFLILILQVASYKTHIKCQLTLITGRCGVLRSTRVLHTMLNRPGTRSNRLGPDPDPADHLKYRPGPERVPGRVPGSRVLCEDLYRIYIAELTPLHCQDSQPHLNMCWMNRTAQGIELPI